MSLYINLMNNVLSLAEKGRGFTTPNPVVGSIVYDEINHKIIGEGFHVFSGGPHAEVNAIQNARFKYGSIEGKTLLVNLEPCCHKNKKTPPCVDLIINSKIKKVVIGCKDPNSQVSGMGIKFLQDAGIEVIEGVLEDECKRINEVYYWNTLNNLPFITMKIACSIDGKIALNNGDSKYITSDLSREMVHNLRFFNDAILIGAKTLILDDPLLDCRLSQFSNINKKRTVIIFGKMDEIDINKFKISKGNFKLVFLNTRKKENKKYPFQIIDHNGSWSDSFASLYRLDIKSILIEPGRKLFAELIKSGCVNKIHMHQSSSIIGKGMCFSDFLEIKNLKDRLFLKPTNLNIYGSDIHYEAYL